MPKHGINKSEIQDLKWRGLPPSGSYLRGCICTIWDLGLAAHYTLWFRPGLDLDISSAIVTCHMWGIWGAHGAKFWSHSSDGVNVICTHWAAAPMSAYQWWRGLDTEPCTLDTAAMSHFSAQRTLGALQRAPPPDITLNCLQLYQPWCGTISAESFALVSFHKNPSPFWMFLWLFCAAWIRQGRVCWRLESTQLGFGIESRPHQTITLF